MFESDNAVDAQDGDARAEGDCKDDEYDVDVDDGIKELLWDCRSGTLS